MNSNILVIITHPVILFIGYIKLDANKILIFNSVLLLVSTSGDFWRDVGNGEKGREAG